MPKREYILATRPQTVRGEKTREIKERIDGRAGEPIAEVPDDWAMYVLDLVRRAYESGRADRTEECTLGPVTSRFTPDEIEALVITAADIWAGERSDLSRHQLDLAERAHRITQGR